MNEIESCQRSRQIKLISTLSTVTCIFFAIPFIYENTYQYQCTCDFHQIDFFKHINTIYRIQMKNEYILWPIRMMMTDF